LLGFITILKQSRRTQKGFFLVFDQLTIFGKGKQVTKTTSVGGGSGSQRAPHGVAFDVVGDQPPPALGAFRPLSNYGGDKSVGSKIIQKEGDDGTT